MSALTAWLAPFTRWFSHRRLPYLTRANYLHELRASMTFPLAAAMAEGSFASVVAQKYFGASALLIAVIVAAPMFGNVLALVWADLADRRPKVRFVNTLQIGVILCTSLVALTALVPREVGVWLFAALMVSARMFTSGIVTAKNLIWRLNFPRHTRGLIVGRVNMIGHAMFAITTFFGSRILDSHPASYVWVYLVCSLLGLIGVIEFSRVKVRGERLALTLMNRRPKVHPLRHLFTLARESVHLLRADKDFRNYQRCQMLQGAAFMMMLPALFSMVNTQMTARDGQYNLATTIVHVLPFVMTTLTISIWSIYFDRMNIVHFRVLQSFSALLTQVVVAWGAMTNQLWLVAMGTFFLGISSAGGNLAWNLGQNAFAPPDKVGTYMGVHVMLTGVRGLFAPFIGTVLYGGVQLGAVQWQGIGRWCFVVAAFVCLCGTIGYIRMAMDKRVVSRDAEAAQIIRRNRPPTTVNTDIEATD
jgi:hypothetical protein